MRLSHLHLAFRDFAGARRWFAEILDLTPLEESSGHALYRFDGVELLVHPDWGDGDTAMTLALATGDCAQSSAEAVARGARSRTAPHDKGASINADVFGPGRLVVEFEQVVTAR